MESFLGTTLGALLIGGLGTAILYGCTNIQIYVYFSNYRQDRLILKSTVVFLWIVDSFHMVFTIIILWHYLIESFGDYLALLTTPWSVKLQNSVNVLAILVVQTLYTMRIWTLSSNLDHKCWARVLSVVLVAGYISGIILVVEIWRTIEYTEVAQYRVLGDLLVTLHVHVQRLYDSSCNMPFASYLWVNAIRDEIQSLDHYALCRHFRDFNKFLLVIRVDFGD
ncbi:hypothetical protein F5887DRAFT_1214796 [Amanita rubescens]|nr:hypothetical protein F5887DRAFT_1214796 [Amanita rubescens]